MVDSPGFDARPGGDLVDLENGLRAWSQITVTTAIPEEPGLTVLAVLRLSSGAYVVDELVVRGDGADEVVTAETLRRVPLRTLVRQAVAQVIGTMNAEHLAAPPDGGRDDEVSAQLRRVTLLYRQARLSGEAPTKYVQEVLAVSRATAARRVAAARERGYLGVDEVGLAGGTPARWETVTATAPTAWNVGASTEGATPGEGVYQRGETATRPGLRPAPTYIDVKPPEPDQDESRGTQAPAAAPAGGDDK